MPDNCVRAGVTVRRFYTDAGHSDTTVRKACVLF